MKLFFILQGGLVPDGATCHFQAWFLQFFGKKTCEDYFMILHNKNISYYWLDGVFQKNYHHWYEYQTLLLHEHMETYI